MSKHRYVVHWSSEATFTDEGDAMAFAIQKLPNARWNETFVETQAKNTDGTWRTVVEGQVDEDGYVDE